MLNTQFAPWPSFDAEEVSAVAEVMRSNKVNYWTGQEGRLFEKEFAEWCGANHAIAVMNGTVALDLALKALQVGPGDEVVVTSRTFLASVSSIINAGATPVFADVDFDTQNITIETVTAVVSSRCKAILCVHLAGWPCDMDPINAFAKQHGLFVIEDCAQAHGALYKGTPVGTLGDVAAWSFCQDKIMTTGGEGGMVTTNSAQLWSKMWSYKDHGKSFDAVYNKDHPPGFRWLHESFGTNWRMLEIQAAIGRLQLRKMQTWSAQRRSNSELIWSTARKYAGFRVPCVPEAISHAAYKCYIFIRPDQLLPEWSRDRIIESLNAQGIPCYSGSCSEVYLEKAFDGTSFRPSKPLEVAKVLGETSLMFLVHPTLTTDQMMQTCSAIANTATSAFRKE
ncbi:DegT/DnrJ/EryC1/StrS family aminotransferase [Pseudomonas sp. KNUC1026]|uniref:DegT/DnrJ/EryC1/StrS family aminotransferase n=1 Tax=Pseudomonas sp. KNUC1026 TaxID=2893890 RepID=UPI001F1FBA73|nr:DegT/DnrJ/EryC1/StrS aminotransferase family protein [Pseudomonas sp. KNUC1026]UFH48246.1 DegT/DnrJ/EryC1/StrS aminotransferase family protein [Pseudomonas sp. KNUC1026]